MERNAHYALVGLLSLVLTISLILFVLWLARLQFARDYDVYDVDFSGPVRGLSAGGEVYFNGIRVGEVTKLSLDARNPNRVVARIRISSDSPVRTDSYASLEPLGITGVNYIQITAGTLTRPLLKDASRADIPVIASRRGSLESLLEGGGTVMARSVDALDRVNRMLSDRNLNTITTTLADVQALTSELRTRKDMIANLDSTIRSADLAAQRVAELSESTNRLVNGDARRTLSNLADAAAELRAAATDGRQMIGKLQGPTTEFASSALPQISATMIQLQVTTESLNRVISEIESNPSRLISKPPAKTVEVQP
jgi:phospholipid/cholesterol/gamma-HCH transport system substrate-binding protein